MALFASNRISGYSLTTQAANPFVRSIGVNALIIAKIDHLAAKFRKKLEVTKPGLMERIRDDCRRRLKSLLVSQSAIWSGCRSFCSQINVSDLRNRDGHSRT